jgi:hypothetical protein
MQKNATPRHVYEDLRRGVSLGILVVALVLAACGAATAGLGLTAADPRPLPKDLAKPFSGSPLPTSWLGVWRDREPSGTYDWHFLAPRSAACRSITRGRTTCYTVGPEGSGTDSAVAYAAGAITRRGGKLVIRMTWVQNPNGLKCFADDAYAYRFTPTRIALLPDTAAHCNRELPDDPFTHLTRVR